MLSEFLKKFCEEMQIWKQSYLRIPTGKVNGFKILDKNVENLSKITFIIKILNSAFPGANQDYQRTFTNDD